LLADFAIYCVILPSSTGSKVVVLLGSEPLTMSESFTNCGGALDFLIDKSHINELSPGKTDRRIFRLL
jgi:hypothetical protein